MSMVTRSLLQGKLALCCLRAPVHSVIRHRLLELKLIWLGFFLFVFREYCKELKVSLNHTQFLLDFGLYIDRNTPNACE